MKIYYNNIPASHLHISQSAPPVPPQAIMSTVTVYKEALDYIKCELTNTIRHEAAHRQDEEERRESDFHRFTDPSRAEPVAESAETDCTNLYPQQLSTPVEVNVSQIFEECKSASGVDPSYLSDVKAVILDDDKLGMYYMQELPGMYDVQEGKLQRTHSGSFDLIRSWDGSLYINVGRHFKDWIVNKDATMTYQPNVQTDGVTKDPDQIRQDIEMQRNNGSVPTVPSVPSVESR